MNLTKVQAFQNTAQLSGSSSMKRLQQVAEMATGNDLSSAERNMISSEFPFGQNKKLELYMASGNSRMENPDARGHNLDFRV